MEKNLSALILSGVGGLYTLRAEEPNTDLPRDFSCRGKGAFRHADTKLLVGDRVTVRYDDAAQNPQQHAGGREDKALQRAVKFGAFHQLANNAHDQADENAAHQQGQQRGKYQGGNNIENIQRF